MRDRTRTQLRTIGLLFGFALLLFLSACSENLPQDSLDPAGPVARRIDDLFWPVFWIAVGVFFLVEGLLVYAMIRFRHRPDAPVPTQVHGNKVLEIGWTILPAAILAVIAIPTIITIAGLARRPTGDVLEVKITAHQFWWQAEYPTLRIDTAGEIHIPTGKPIYLSIESTDVIHSFWVPRLAGKQDAVPGRTNTLTIQADRPGNYHAQCAEFCGLSHANMRFRVIAESPSSFDAWVQDQQREAAPPPGPALQIMQEAGCGGCHVIRGVEGFVGKIGPDLTHFASRGTFAGAIFPNDPEHVRAWLEDPPAAKPGVDMPDLGLSGDEIDTLVAYLEGLR